MKKILLIVVVAVFLTGAFAFTNTTKDVDNTVNTTKVETTTLNPYEVVTGKSPSELQYEVVKSLSRGYRYQGGVTYANGLYAQAMVK